MKKKTLKKNLSIIPLHFPMMQMTWVNAGHSNQSMQPFDNEPLLASNQLALTVSGFFTTAQLPVVKSK